MRRTFHLKLSSWGPERKTKSLDTGDSKVGVPREGSRPARVTFQKSLFWVSSESS